MLILKAPTPAAPFEVLAVALLVLIPIAYLGFASMARLAAPALTAAYLLANAALLIPIREPNRAALIGGALFGAILLIDRLVFHRNPALKTWDGNAMRSVMFVPVAVLAVRNLLSYESSAMFVSFLAATIGVTFESVLPAILPQQAGKLSRSFGGILLIFAWFEFLLGAVFGIHPVFTSLAALISDGLYLPLNTLPIAAFMVYRSIRLGNEGRSLGRNGATLAIGSSIANLFLVGGLPASFVCLVVSFITVIGAFAVEDRNMLYAGGAGIAAALLFYLRYAWQIAEISPWLSLAVLGTGTVVFSSYVERNHQRLFEKFGRFKVRVLGWS